MVAVFLIGGACNQVPLQKASKFVMIGCAIVSVIILVARIALVCYRNKRRKMAKVKMINDLVFRP